MILPRAARLALVERENPELPLTQQVDLLSLARACQGMAVSAQGSAAESTPRGRTLCT